MAVNNQDQMLPPGDDQGGADVFSQRLAWIKAPNLGAQRTVQGSDFHCHVNNLSSPCAARTSYAKEKRAGTLPSVSICLLMAEI